MKIAVIGSGIAGLTAAYRLNDRHEIHLFEAMDHLGGHTRTVPVEDGDRIWNVDTGFVVFNTETYGGLCGLFDELDIDCRESCMSFSVHCPRTGFEYQGSGLGGYYASATSLLSPAHHLMLRDINRFHGAARRFLEDPDPDVTLDQWVVRGRYGRAFRERYLFAIGASIWSCPQDVFASFPAAFVLAFMANHRMLQIRNRPIWRTVVGGSDRYVAAIEARLRGPIHRRTPVRSVSRNPGGPTIQLASGERRTFDHVILACHADQARSLVDHPEPEERRILDCFPYTDNDVVLHTDDRLLPRRRRARASWNFRLGAGDDPPAVTYDMSRLQGLASSRAYCITLNATELIRPEHILLRFTTAHPTYHALRADAQGRHRDLIDRRGISYCGAYWGYGFHEDGYQSGLRVAEHLADRS